MAEKKAVTGFQLWEDQYYGDDSFRSLPLPSLPHSPGEPRLDLYQAYSLGLSELWEQRAAKQNVENGVIPSYCGYESKVFAWRDTHPRALWCLWDTMTVAQQHIWYQKQIRPLQKALSDKKLPMIQAAFKSMGFGPGVMEIIAKHCGVLVTSPDPNTHGIELVQKSHLRGLRTNKVKRDCVKEDY